MGWSADIVTEPARDHKLCVDLFEDSVHRARIQLNERGELELVSYGERFAIPAEWLVAVIERFIGDIGYQATTKRS